MRLVSILGMCAAALMLAGCDDPTPRGETGNGGGGGTYGRPEMMMAADAVPRALSAVAKAAPSPRMEVRRNYVFEIEGDDLSAALQADRTACLKLGCVVTEMSSTKERRQPFAVMNVLVPQKQAEDFHQFLVSAEGRDVISFQISAQNREEQHQDIVARLERLEFMRKRLYALAEKKSDKIGDLLQVERELTRVEQEIEHLTRNRKSVEKVTDNVAFALTYHPRPPKAGDVDFTPLKGVLADMANTFIWGARVTVLWLARWSPAALLGLLAVWVVWRRKGRADRSSDGAE